MENLAGMLDPLDIFFSILYGIIGMGYLAYGKRNQSFYFMMCGLFLMLYTLVTTSTGQVIWFGAGLCAAPFILDRYL